MADSYYSFAGIDFVWDENKNRINKQKHRISFEEACEAFFDPFVKWIEEQDHYGEKRDVIVGTTKKARLLWVVHIELGNMIRIVSARPADRAERKAYED